jgi:hypothetical protein
MATGVGDDDRALPAASREAVEAPREVALMAQR